MRLIRAPPTRGVRPDGRVREQWRTMREGTTVAAAVAAAEETVAGEGGMAKMVAATASQTVKALCGREDGVSDNG